MGSMKDFMKSRKAPPAAGKPAPPAKQEAPPAMIITQACGHKVGVGHLQGSKCPACVNAKRKAKREAREAAGKSARRQPDDRRLPDGSRFDVTYDAGSQWWHGTLTVPGLAPFEGTESGVFKLLAQLDAAYRAAKEAPLPGSPPAGTGVGS